MFPKRNTNENPCFSKNIPMIGLNINRGRLLRIDVCHDTSSEVPFKASRMTGNDPPRNATSRLHTHHQMSNHQNLALKQIKHRVYRKMGKYNKNNANTAHQQMCTWWVRRCVSCQALPFQRVLD